MTILCDTCSIIMLIRIAPEMFIDERFECVTIHDVREEFIGTQKFKTRYPWRSNFKDKIQPLKTTLFNTKSFNEYLTLITNMMNSISFNCSTNRNYSLSAVDMKIAACALANKFTISTTDKDLMNFLFNEFDLQNDSPLKLVNTWIKQELIKWNETFDNIVNDWSVCQEAPQPQRDISEFERLTGYKYLGP